MIDKVQKIREEVARIQLYTQSEVLKQILDYIYKVQEEPVLSNVERIGKNWKEPVSEDFEKKFISFVNATHDNNGSYSLHDFAQRLYNIAKEELKEPVSEDFEKIVEEIAEPTILNAYGTKELARRLCNTIYDTSVSEDLEEAATQYGINNFPNLCNGCKHVPVDAFKAGAKWQKEQMMKDAITAHCFGFQGAALFSFRLPANNYLVGSELKVTVIKEVE